MAVQDAVDWNYFISERGRKWQPSSIRGLFPLEARPNMISLLAGKPNPETFPFETISITLKPLGNTPAETLTIDGDALNQGLQYGPTAGLKPLLKWVEELQEKKHMRPNDGSWRSSLGSGSQDLISKAMHALINEGDSVLLETPVYSGTLGVLRPEPAILIEVETDSNGLIPEKLEEMLASWSSVHPGKRFPKLLYTIPTGSNPTGCSCPLDRKIAILAIARKYNLLILEDDAYYFLHFNRATQSPSYFELEVQNGGTPGRVVRFDTFSKIISSGMRLGFVTAAKEIVDIIDLDTANSNLQPSSTTQAIAMALFEKWGYDGFLEHTRRVAAFYDAQRAMFEAAAHKHLDGLASWVSPEAGMFLYLKLDLPEPADSKALIATTAVEKGVLAVPGTDFMPSASRSQYVRCSYSLATEKDADEALRRLAQCIIEAKAN